MKKYDFTNQLEEKKLAEKKSIFKFLPLKTKTSAAPKQKKLVESKELNKLLKFPSTKALSFPIDQPITDDGLIHTMVLGKSEFSYILRVQGNDLTGLTENEYDQLLENYWSLHKSYQKPFKEIFCPFPENTEENIAYFKHRNETAQERSKIFNSSPLEIERKNALRTEEIRKLEVIQKDFQSHQSFIAIYGETVEKLEENYRDICEYGGKILGLEKLEKSEVELLFKILNGLEKDSNSIAPKQIDFSFAKQVVVNHQLEAIISVSAFSQELKNAWMLAFINNDKIEATTIDHEAGKENYLYDMSRSVDVLQNAADNAKKQTNRTRLNTQKLIVEHKHQDLESKGEVIKKTAIRMIVRSDTPQHLQEKVKQLVSSFKSKGFNARVFPNMGFYDWSSRFVSARVQGKISTGRQGVECSSEALALGYAHNQTSLSDKYGSFLGRTRTGGTVLYNEFIKTDNRLSYSSFTSGTKGSGKSTSLKKRIIDNFIHDNFVYIYDKARECKTLVEYLGGAYLSLDGSDGKINMFQVFPLIARTENKEQAKTDDDNPWEVFNAHISRMVEHFQKWTDLTTDGKTDVVYILNAFFESFYTDKGYRWKAFDITGLGNQEYPTFDDFYNFLDGFEPPLDYQETYRKLKKMVYSVVTTKREKFVGTTTLDNLLTKQIVAFDISNVSEGSSDDFDILFSISLDMVLSLAQNRGRIEKEAFESKTKSFEDITRTLIVIDECHTVLNPDKLQNTRVIVNALREDRKYFYGFAFATQMIETMLPTNAKQVGDDRGIAIQNMANIIGLCQYRVWLRQSAISIETLKKHVKDDFKESDYTEMQNYQLKKGLGSQMILAGAGRRSLEMYFFASSFEVNLFKGGA